MSREAKIKIIALFVFFLLTFIHLIPLTLNSADSLSEPIDCVLNTWTLSWINHQFFSNPLKLFDANIFFPLHNTLSFSEHLFPQAIIFIPVYRLFENHILAYNFVFFLSIILNAYAMFLLVRYLTKNDFAGIAGGIMFAFSTFHLHHITHLQLLSSWPIPLAFLYLHKFFDDKKLKYSVFFSLFFTIQAFVCVYYGLFFLSMLVVILPVFLLSQHKKINIPFLSKLCIPLLISTGVLFVFSIPYLSLFKTFGFQRELSKGADPINYLAVIPKNVFLNKILTPLGTAEHFLFPGIAAVVLAGFYLLHQRKIQKHISKTLNIAGIVIGLSILISLMVIMIIRLNKGFILKLGLFTISANSSSKQALSVLMLCTLYFILAFFLFIFREKGELSKENTSLFLYVFIFFWALFLSFGGIFIFAGESLGGLSLPFKWFYDFVPGFKGIRVPARYAIFVIFSVAILAGYGLKLLNQKIKDKNTKIFLAAALFIFLNLEYLSVPQRIIHLPTQKYIPPTYQWLRENAGDSAFVELPFQNPIGKDAIYMYFSLFHNKRMVNGYSGFFPPFIFYVRKIFKGFPSWASLDILKTLRVKYIVLHKKMMKAEKAENTIGKINDNFKSDLTLKKEFFYKLKDSVYAADNFGQDLIYEVNLEQEAKEPKISQDYREVPSQDWTIQASRSENLLHFITDGDINTNWTSDRPKTTGDYLLIEFKEPLKLAKVSLYQGKFTFDYALRIRVEISLDGKEWRKIRRLFSPGEFVQNLIQSPQNLVQNIHLDGRKTKYLKIIQVGNDNYFWWSVTEIKIYEEEKRKKKT